MKSTHGFVVLAIVIGSVVGTDARADEPTKKQCIEANAEAQKQQNEGKLRAAQTSLLLCSSTACPAVVRNDCTQLLDGLMKRLPSLVFEAHDAAGADLTAVRVFVDGQPLAERLDGTSLAVDPGEHTFRFESARLAAVSTKLVIREGDRARRERVTFGAAAAPPPPPPAVALSPPERNELPPPSDAPAPSSSSTSTLRYVGYVTSGVGVVGVGLGVIFGLRAKSKLDDSRVDPGGQGCDAQDFCGAQGKALRSDAQTAATISTIGFISGGVLLATGVGIILFAPSGSKGTAASVTPLANAGGGGALFRGTF